MNYMYAGLEYSSKYLTHHGILGQKWGVRRFQYEDGSLTPAGRERYESEDHGTFMGQDRNQDIRIKAGSYAQRVSSKANESSNGRTYVSFDKLDHLKYIADGKEGGIGVDPDGVTINTKDRNGYSLKLKVTNDIIAPSYSKSIEAFQKSVMQIGLKEVAKSVDNSDYKTKQFIKDMKKMKVQECRDRAYAYFTQTLMRNEKNRETFFNLLKGEGYNAVIDENDVKFGKGGTSSAMIVFDKSKNLKQTQSRAISDRDVSYAQDRSFGEVNALSEDGKKLVKEMKKRWGL